MQIIKQIYPSITRTIITLVICLAVVAGVSLVSAWTGPTATPPDGNTPAPINVSATQQIKSGPLQVNGFRNLGTTILDGNVGIGTAEPSAGFKLDVNGGIQGVGIQAYVPNLDSRTGLVIRNPNGFATIYSSGAHGNGLGFYTNSDETPANARMVIDGISGNVGIGTAVPQSALQIGTPGSGKYLQINYRCDDPPASDCSRFTDDVGRMIIRGSCTGPDDGNVKLWICVKYNDHVGWVQK